MLSVLVSHGEGIVGELVWLALLRLHHEPVGARPVLAVNDRLELPQLVRSVDDHEILGLLVPHVRAEVLYLLERGHSRAHPRERESQWTRPLHHAFQLLLHTNYVTLSVRRFNATSSKLHF